MGADLHRWMGPNLPWKGFGQGLKSVLSKGNACMRSSVTPANFAASKNMLTAVGLRSVAVTLQLGLAFRMGSRLEPAPHPISAKCCGGSWTVNAGNSNRRYLQWTCHMLLPSCDLVLAVTE